MLQLNVVLLLGATPPLWGGGLVWTALNNSMTDPDEGSHAPWLFDYYYDARVKASRWEHGSGQHDWVCSQGSPSKTQQGEACTVLHATDGWLYISFGPWCCKCTDDPAMGFTEPDWLRKPQTRDMGAETVNGVRAERWFLDANFTSYDNNYWATADAQQRPVRFLEHISGKAKVWDFSFAPGAFVANVTHAALLAPPAECSAKCGVIAVPGGYPSCTWQGAGGGEVYA